MTDTVASMNFYCRAEPDRGVLRVSGADRASFLQGLISNDIRLVSEHAGIWSALLTPQGKYLFDFFVTEPASGDCFLVETEAARTDALRRKLLPFRLRARVAIEDASGELACWFAWGRDVASLTGLMAPGTARAIETGTMLADPRAGLLGVRLLAPADDGCRILDAVGFRPGQWTDWDRCRIASGIPDGSRDLEIDRTILLEAGFDRLNGVSFDKGCYMGQELTARTHYRGLVKRRLVPVEFAGPPPAPGTTVLGADGSELGDIRSGLEGLALASLRLEALRPGVHLAAAGVALSVATPPWFDRGAAHEERAG